MSAGDRTTARGAPSEPGSGVKPGGTTEWRPLGRDQRPEVADIVAAAGVFRSDELEVALEVFDASCVAPGQDYHGLGAFDPSGGLAGFVLYGPTPCTLGTWDVYWIVVRPDAQGCGVGRGLLTRVESEMRRLDGRLAVIETSSREDYSSTRNFYLSCGYREVARIPEFYDRGDDRITYAKRLTEPSSPGKGDRDGEVGRK